MTIREFMKELDRLYPRSLSCSWDNDGLMCCDDDTKEVRRVLVSLDATRAAIQYAADNGYDLLLTHHPMIFRGEKAVTTDRLSGGRAILALKNGVSVISLHTRLDAGTDGVNERICKMLGLTNIRPFGDDDCPTLGRIGDTPLYTHLGFSYFWPTVKLSLNLPYMETAGEHNVYHVAVVGGAGDDLLEAAKAAGADTFITGEMGYNRMEDAAEMGMNILICGHFFTEVPVCDRLSEIAKSIAGAEVGYYNSNPIVIR
ncbi:MAG: Nif3-like dinuclear metal center hexameric protein [Clostridia bacterium]|nr:Nif3-like dinuclear metal center hexameric protein [Clostridia bacterium]